VLQDIASEFQRAPPWAQIGMAFFAFTVVVFFLEPLLVRRRFHRRFDALARALNAQPPESRALPASFRVSVDGRAFEVRHAHRTTNRSSSYRGPTGFLLITATRLASTRWSLHQVDIVKPGTVGSWLLRRGGADAEGRLMVREDGLPVREGWLDAATRAALTRFLEAAPDGSVLWIREGELTCTVPTWATLDGVSVRALLQQQAVLADALNATAARA